MSILDELKNRGLLALGPATVPMTLVVVGVARGGTSIVAGALHHLGVFMGDRAGAPVFEDMRLATPMEAGDWGEFETIAREYQKNNHVWGFKRPSAARHLDRLHRLLRNPVYIFVFRDVLAIAQRNALSMKANALPEMRRANEIYGKILDFVTRAHPPGLLLSAEKALIHKDEFIDGLVEFLGLEVTPEQRQRAKNFIVVDPPSYLDKSRLVFQGLLENATTKFVAGWAGIRNWGGAVKLRISVNDVIVVTVVAKAMREDVRDCGAHETGACGFRFNFPEGLVRYGDQVAVQFELGGEHLRRSPITIQ